MDFPWYLGMMRPALHGVRAVLFDAVGTLITPKPAVADVYHAAGRRHGSALARDEVSRRFSNAFRRTRTPTAPTNEQRERETWRQIVANVFTDVTDCELLFHELWDHFATPSCWRLYDDVSSAWQELTQREYTLGVASNFDERLIGICQTHPPLNNCQHLFWSAQLRVRKPDPAFYVRVAERLQLEPAELLLIGDDLHNDYLGARAAGWRSLLIVRESSRTVPDTIGQADTVRNLTEIPRLLAVEPN